MPQADASLKPPGAKIGFSTNEMAVAKYVFRQPDPFEYSKSINYSILYEFLQRKLYGEQDGDLFTKNVSLTSPLAEELLLRPKENSLKIHLPTVGQNQVMMARLRKLLINTPIQSLDW